MGSRKFRFAMWGLGSLCAGFGAAAALKVPADLYETFAWSVVGIVLSFGVPNVGEHVAQALKARREGAAK